MAFSLKIPDDKLNEISQYFDPDPVLRELAKQTATEASTMNPSFQLKAPGSTYSSMLGLTQPTDNGSGGPKMPGLDAKSLAMLQSMMPQPIKPQFIGGAAPRVHQVNIPGGGVLPGLPMPPAPPAIQPPLSLAALLQGRQ